jgi:hypothetical protein
MYFYHHIFLSLCCRSLKLFLLIVYVYLCSICSNFFYVVGRSIKLLQILFLFIAHTFIVLFIVFLWKNILTAMFFSERFELATPTLKFHSNLKIKN